MSDESALREFVPGWVMMRRSFAITHWTGRNVWTGYQLNSPTWRNAPYLFNAYGTDRWFVDEYVYKGYSDKGRWHLKHSLAYIPSPTVMSSDDMYKLIGMGLHDYTLHKIKEAAGVS